jgi:hypothetical protein
MTADRSMRSHRSAGRGNLTQLQKRLQKLERAEVRRDPRQIAKGWLSDADRELLEKLNYDRSAFDEAHRIVWVRWESAPEDAKAGREYPIPVLSEVFARI